MLRRSIRSRRPPRRGFRLGPRLRSRSPPRRALLMRGVASVGSEYKGTLHFFGKLGYRPVGRAGEATSLAPPRITLVKPLSLCRRSQIAIRILWHAVMRRVTPQSEEPHAA